MSNIESIKGFIQEGTKSKLLVNQVNDEIGFFYVGVIENEANIKNIKLNYKDNFIKENAGNLFEVKEIDLYFSNSKKIIEQYLESDRKCIIFTDYKNFKLYSSSLLTINGYDYSKDIKYYLREILDIKNNEIINFCLNNPYLTFSEVSKYLINSSGYIKENDVITSNNFILEIRKELFNLKKNQKDPLKIYTNLKTEVKYKKFNFLAY